MRPLMWFVGPWPPPFIEASHTHKKAPPCRHTHTQYSTYIHLHTLYAFHTLRFLLTHFLSGIRNGVLWCRYINGGQWGPRGLQWLFLPSKNLRKVLAGWSWKPTKFSSSRVGEWGALAPPQKQNGEKNLHQNSQLGKNAWQPNSNIVSVMVMTGLSLLCLFHTSDVCGPLNFKGWEAISN